MPDHAPDSEPRIFACGDTLYFTRYLPAYTSADGWALEYALTNLGGQQVATFNGVADDKGNFKISVENFAVELPPGQYILAGYIVNAGKGYRHQIFYGNFKLTPDLLDGTASTSLKTEAQEMLDIIRPTLKQIYGDWMAETDVQRNRFLKQQLDKVRAEYVYWKEARMIELENERARNGQPLRRISQPSFSIG